MKRYRKKPIVIEAFQMTKERRQDNSEWPSWLIFAWQEEVSTVGIDKLVIRIEEGYHTVDWNDYIIMDVKGEFQIDVIKPDIFKANYEEITDGGE